MVLGIAHREGDFGEFRRDFEVGWEVEWAQLRKRSEGE